MAGPWEKYQTKAEVGPWTKYQSQDAVAPAEDVIATTDDGGRVIRRDGKLLFTSPAYSTNDPAKIAEIMEGATPADVSRSGFDQATIEQAPVTARAVKAVEGVPFVGSYVDEAAGALFGDKAREGVRAVSGSMDRERPGQSAALGMAGAVAGSIPLAVATGPAIAARAAGTLGARAIQAAGLGAVAGATEGAVHGFGRGEGDDRARNAGDGFVLGGILGAALGGAAPYASEGVKRAMSQLKGSDVRLISKVLGISVPAARTVKNTLDTGNIDDAIKALARVGDNAMLADAGQPARAMLDAAANTGGKAGKIVADAIDDRVTGAAADTVKVLDRVLGKPSGVKAMARGVREGTAAARDDAYSAAYSMPIDYAKGRGQAILGLLRRVPKSAIDDANELMRLEGVDSAQILAKVGDGGTVTFTKLPDVRQIDYITRALGGVADKADGQGKLGGQTPLGRGYQALQKQIRSVLKSEVPEYAKALDVASDAISRVKAGEVGYSLLRQGTTRETVRDALEGASRAEREAMAQGVRTAIDDAMANVQGVLTDPNTDAREALKVLRTMSSRANQQKMQMLLGEKKAAQLFDELDKATVAFELRAALAQNSKTAIRQSLQESVKKQAAPGALETLASGSPVDAGKRFVQIFTGSTDEAQALRESGIYEEIATALTQTKGRKAQAALRAVKRAMEGRKISEQEAAFIGNVLATSGVLVGNRQGTTYLSTQ